MADVEFKLPALPEKPEEEPKSDEQPKDETPLQLSIREPLLSYDPPVWACRPPEDALYKLEIIKSGTIVETINMANRKHDSFFVIGRLPSCDLTLEHPSLSRHHCILQYGVDTMNRTGKAWHLYDMESTHGTKANRQKMPPKQYIRMHIGWVLSFGLSTRSMTLIGPDEEKQKEWDVSPTEMIELMKRKELERKLAAKAKEEFDSRKKEEEKDEGIDWGMGFDFETGESGLVHLDGNDAHLMEDHEGYYRDDPKKALAKFFDREGFDMEFVFSESGINSHNHKWICSIEAVHASATVATSKKDAQFQCSLEACRILDGHGVLRKSTARSKLKKKTLEDEDFYEEDDDEYLDRTGQVDIQRERRKNRAQGIKDGTSKTHTYESILSDLEEAKKEIEELNAKYERLNASANVVFDEENAQIKETSSKHEDIATKTEKSKVRQRITELTHQVQRLEQLAKIAKPIPLPAMTMKLPTATASTSDKQAFFRKLRQLGKQKKADEPNDAGNASELQMPQVSSKFVAEIEEDDDNGNVSEKPKEESDSNNTKDASVTLKPVASPLNVKKPESKASVEQPQSRIVTQEEKKREPIALKGPILVEEPEITVLQQPETPDEDEYSAHKKRPRNQKPRKRKIEDSGDYGEGLENKEEQYATWIPPTDQSGDGSTQLNARFQGRY
ncbi:unnamed protein product, partial [Mesorhabditis belari]|uniref:FHA domain-containing protein n=1 Tax=Mesorhabditis belari TaxID=2138241 RepID=A0AAF3FQ00_9BILA